MILKSDYVEKKNNAAISIFLSAKYILWFF